MQLPPTKICKPKTSSGFTLIEIMIVVSIIAIIAGAFFLNLREGERNLALQRSAQLVIQAVEEARNSTLANRLHAGTVSAGGYGVRFQDGLSSVIVFADCNQDGRYNASGGASSCIEAASGPLNFAELYSIIELEEGVTISGITPCDGPCVLDLKFSSPNANAVFGPSLVGADAFITLQGSDGDQLSVVINGLGISRVQ
ncbi:MAG: hypothetical protein A2932_00245 [Candidatus Spechtbacteria bacterium RIFCSPLOWO2_01_FULL_46_10]|uniref:General secretion pathway GspH domain-containing protein n=1 Tax=Candidatus Spechtbacteria bacterium RIFCSPLOWO2_01_FULL_46_10 TaxID=1802163 RepID=A0A1G2HF83_9BACT|nr:MAG: hypothetical protein A2932_00245 [Candidatus Spechtbacteria bacterium RIFCSPLOWO2_01_FULL_46_10]